MRSIDRQSIRPIIAMSKMFEKRNGLLAIAVAGGMLRGPVAQRLPVPALALLAVTRRILAPRVEQRVPGCALHVLPEAVEAMRRVAQWVGQGLPSGDFKKGLPDDFKTMKLVVGIDNVDSFAWVAGHAH